MILAFALGSQLAWAQSAPPPPPPLAPPLVVEDADQRQWTRGRRVLTSGLFLGWAGLGLATGGAALASGGRDTGPVTNRQLFSSSIVAGSGLAAVGLTLQVIGAEQQRRASPPSLRMRRNVWAAGLAGLGVVGCGLLSWRLLGDGPDGLWIVVAAPAAVIGTLGATGLHTISLIEGDVEGREVGLRATLGPGFVSLEGRF